MPDGDADPGAEPDGVTFVVPGSLAGERVDRAVALVTGYSRADIQALIAADEVLVDGASIPKSHRLSEGATVAVVGRPEPPQPPSAEPIELQVRYEDEHVAVIAKPAGMVVHPGAGNETGTLAHGVLHRWPRVAGVGDPMRPGIVHRLDRDTSGLLAVALSPDAYEGLVARLAAREVERRYLALVWGRPEPAQGVVDAPVGRSMRRPTQMAVTPRGREARTGYQVREAFGRTALLEISLDTGRTHQIRVHLASIGHPVAGDPVYGQERRLEGLGRPFLHAYRLAFEHPATGETLSLEEPLPVELNAVLDALREEQR